MQQAYFTLTHQDTEILGFTLIDESGARIDLTGSAVVLTIRLGYDNIEYLLQKSADMTDPSADLDQGYVVFRLTKDNTDIPPGKYNYDLQITWSSGSLSGTRKTVTGKCDVLRDYTR